MAGPGYDRVDTKDGETPNIQIPSRTYGFPPEAFDWSRLPDFDTDFLPPEHVEAFIQALSAPDPIPPTPDGGATGSSSYRLNSPAWHRGSTTSFDLDLARRPECSGVGFHDEDRTTRDSPAGAATAAAAGVATPGPPLSRRASSNSLFISARNDWAPISQRRVARAKTAPQSSRNDKKKKRARSKDETREGYLYPLLKWPLLGVVTCWLVGLSVVHVLARLYITVYERYWAWRGERGRLRRAMRATGRYSDWVAAARRMDDFLGNDSWKVDDAFAYYDNKTVRRVLAEIRRSRRRAEEAGGRDTEQGREAIEDLKVLIEACVKNNFAGIENPRLYSQTYYGTKNLVQNYIDEVERSLKFLVETERLSKEEKRVMFKGICANYGRTALCLSGGATFAYYHFGVVKALLEEDYLPDIITGTSGGALVAALVATRTNEELKELLIPALACRITACREPISVWFRRWWATGARFDSVDWARQCAWWTRGSLTFREAYERTGRILNVSCVPADQHSPTILCNYLTSPDCVIWSAVLASAAVPGILNPVVLLMKTRSGQLLPYSFGHKWKDGSLRTDIPIKALNLQFNVNFTIVSQVNPHINLFFFSSRGSVGQPVTHRRGRGWRGGYLGTVLVQFTKLDLTKWLRVLRSLELLPRPLGQDWSLLWLQDFGGTVTVWPRCLLSDFARILSDPDPARLARMIHEGQQSAFPKLRFVANRLRVERLVERGRRENRRGGGDGGVGTGGGSGGSGGEAEAVAGQAAGPGTGQRRPSFESILSEDDLRSLLKKRRVERGGIGSGETESEDETSDFEADFYEGMTYDGGDDDAGLEFGAAGMRQPGVATPTGLGGVEREDLS
ncbi:patatin-like phospholipase domain-containing protein [Chaetomium tenue]|uniref:Patatin-like phospholipase domain-containing protein n=1 Tax=Chaetomium tenue TaxID=1854479 RepID=A0ACB7PBV8_9PEZI|nr:patatin-like phospholipase domain-containing protein [Chaetomium globosum]